jgi:N-formylglutamate deformylase
MGDVSGTGVWPATVLHVPHASRTIPVDVRQELLLDDAEMELELLRMTDAYTDELFAMSALTAVAIDYPVSRLVVDPERFRDDANEPMAARGMGAVYTRTADGRPLRDTIHATERERLLAEWYDPHHRRLAQAVELALDNYGYCLIIDCHSFPSIPLPCDLDGSVPRPDICIGTDSFHTPPGLLAAAVDFCERRRMTFAVDKPYAGSIVPSRWHRQDRRVLSIMVEVNRALYMDEANGEKLPDFAACAGMCRLLCDSLSRTHYPAPSFQKVFKHARFDSGTSGGFKMSVGGDFQHDPTIARPRATD